MNLATTEEKELFELVMNVVEEYMYCIVGIHVENRKEVIPFIISILYHNLNSDLYEKV